jgi:hypothetical protein
MNLSPAPPMPGPRIPRLVSDYGCLLGLLIGAIEFDQNCRFM